MTEQEFIALARDVIWQDLCDVGSYVAWARVMERTFGPPACAWEGQVTWAEMYRNHRRLLEPLDVETCEEKARAIWALTGGKP